MDYATLIHLAELAGVCVFSISGALAAQGQQMDILCVVVLAIVTALGGGTLRDIMLNAHPSGWVVNNVNLWTAIVSAVTAFLACRYLPYLRRTLLVLDAAGLALFAILGAEKAHVLGVSPGSS
ncbi:MAG: TRIC cation channel family protein [Rubrivivax sp.]